MLWPFHSDSLEPHEREEIELYRRMLLLLTYQHCIEIVAQSENTATSLKFFTRHDVT